MKRILFLLAALFIGTFCYAQSSYYMRYDTVVIVRVGGNGELTIMNAGRDSQKGGVLYNIGGGRTAFKKTVALNDSTLIIGGDTVVILGGVKGGSALDTTSLSARIDSKVNISDTLLMLYPFLRKNDTASLSNRIDQRVKYSDTAAMLAVYLRKADTASLSNRIDERMKYSDTVSLSNRIDGKQPVGNYITGLNGDVAATGPGLANAVLAATSVTPGTYKLATVGVDQKGRTVLAANGVVEQINDSTFRINEDTITIRGTGGGADSTIYATIYGVDTAKANLRDEIASKQDAGNYITALTGPVTATGPGSAATSITNNAITDAMLRQSAANSVIGRSSNTTGNVADITSTTVGTYLKRATSAVQWDSVDYADLKNRPDLQNPGVYFSPAQAFDPSFVVFASAIARTSNSYSLGNPITWEILDHVTDHNSSFYDSVTGDGSGIGVRFPTVKNVINTTITGDETFASNMVSLGSTTALTGLGSPVIRPAVLNIRLTGNGSGAWSTSNGLGFTARWELSSFSSGATSFNIIGPASTVDYSSLNIQYIGTNNYHIRRVYSGLGSYNVRFFLVDEFGNDVTDNPTSSDEVIITAGAMTPVNTGMGTWSVANQFIDGFANFWIFGVYECWLVAAPTSSTSTLVRWQNTYPSATNYKIYRATSLYGSRTLIHTGTDDSYIDTGLSSGTLYWYFMIATIGGVDTEITYFRTSTKD